MPRAIVLAVGLIAGLLAVVAPHSLADDSLTPEAIAEIKGATVYIRVEGDGWSGSGSGFVFSADKERLLVVTNHHVALKLPPGARPKPPVLSVVFGSGTKTEREYPATVVGSDEDRDLAVLRVIGVKDPPKPIPYADPPKPVETMGVYSFGFPLGQALSVRKGFPAITVGKASVSSLREGEDGELAVIQIDGNLNPGNSGGPVVDGKGRLIGVAVARAKDGQGIGFLIPAVEVGRLVAGRIERTRVVIGKGTDGKPTAKIEAELVDPAGVLQSATAYCVVVPPKGKSPDSATLDKHPDARKVALKIEKGVATGELSIEKAEGTVVVQVMGTRGAGADPIATRSRAFSLAPGVKHEDLAGPPPAGWKEYSPPHKAFVVWLPEKPSRQSEEKRKITMVGETFPSTGVMGKSEDGLTYRAETVDLPLALARLAAKLYPALRNSLREETRGRITESVEAHAGALVGAEYRIESDQEITRIRVFIQGKTIYMVRVVGTTHQVATAEADTILISFRKPGDLVVKTPVPTPTPTPKELDPKVLGIGKEPFILGSIAHDPKFKTIGPDGAILIGVEARFAKFGGTDIVRGVRPIYRVNGKEEFGKQFGNDLTGSVTLKAKDGYAVGGITGKAGWWCNGFALTFMKVKADGTLDPKDSYESEWAGFNGQSEVFKVMSEGAPVIGIVGKIVGPETTALGLLFKGQEAFEINPAAISPEDLYAEVKAPTIVGGGNAPKFKDVTPDAGMLIGLEIGLGKFGNEDVIKAVRPIYRVGDDEKLGEQHGTQLTRVSTIKAKAGYAVGAITYKFGLNFDGCSLTFMKVVDGKLDPKDRYESDWVGWDGNKQPSKIESDGKVVVGIAGRVNRRDVTGLGLLFKGQEDFDPNAPPGPKVYGVGKEPFILGSIAHDPKFKTIGPDGAILIGVEARFGKFGSIDIVRGVRPIYRVNGKEEFGKQFGNDLTGSVTLKAKDGYAVGGITGKAGWWCNGFSLTFMKVKADGTLDPKDSYESEWVGSNGKSEVFKVVSDGTPVVGIVGKIVGPETTALGLLFKGQESFDPNAKR